jgi:2-oxoglutarate ferredoxin oxidoreductase subunit beta
METATRSGKDKYRGKTAHLAAPLLRTDRMPHIWCPGCGIGTTVNCFAAAIERSGIDRKKICVVSGIGCTGRVAGYVRLDSFHTTHGRAIPFATGLALANPELRVVVYSGDGDIAAIGGNHLIHAARRNVNITVICVNNFIYGMTGGQVAPTTPQEARASTAPYGCYEPPFNLPYLAESCGAVYVARWTAAHVRQLSRAMAEALQKNGFSFVEAIAPCPTLFGRLNRAGDGLDMMKFYRDNSEIQNQAPTRELDIVHKGKIIVGKFVDKQAPTYLERMNAHLRTVLGERYVPWGEPQQLGEDMDQ